MSESSNESADGNASDDLVDVDEPQTDSVTSELGALFDWARWGFQQLTDDKPQVGCPTHASPILLHTLYI
jgi:hypothetical protein